MCRFIKIMVLTILDMHKLKRLYSDNVHLRKCGGVLVLTDSDVCDFLNQSDGTTKSVALF